ncbi:hypothetical protein DRE_02584 [Drechslerella stenobrocha 248]|uniref:glucan endo-1,3-beta-D-glucosidase n=1 Tax=Drechslerella stenobrocha 248 TaxID=1043628 RepID=W7IFU1_9PEZI|nr:hypothetical protein DRE_02584 [Drechslerella stenobrocha 248]
MLRKSAVFAALAAASVANAQGEYLGFNYGASKANFGPVKVYEDFKEEFLIAQNLTGTEYKFTSARLYTMIQGPSKDDPISAIKAAIDTNTTLLLGMWCSAGQDIVTNEINAVLKAINLYGSRFTNLVVGLSVGSEDLYRSSEMGIQNESGIGAQPAELVKYIGQVRRALAGTPLKSVPIGHVDTWTVWVNGSNSAVVDALDWIGFDAYPYFQNTMSNTIDQAPQLFWEAYENTIKATGKEVWITETGWPVQGKNMNLAKANSKDAKQYWDQIGCAIFGKYKTWWYMLRDADPVAPETEFGIVGADLKPYYDLSCKNAKPVARPLSTSTAASSTARPSSTGASSRTIGSNSAPGTFAVETTAPTSTGAPAGAPAGAAQTTGSNNTPSSAFSIRVTVGLVAANAIAIAFLLL